MRQFKSTVCDLGTKRVRGISEKGVVLLYCTTSSPLRAAWITH